MRSDLDDIRAALEHQLALFGDLVLVDESAASAEALASVTEAATPVSGTEPLADTSEEAPEVMADEKIMADEPVAEPAPQPQPIPESEPEPSTLPELYAQIEALIPDDSPLRGMKTLEEVNAWVASTELIELDRTRKNPVFGVGNPQADLMVIGEAPGADEDEQGEPFVGRAGQLLTKILDAIGFARKDVYIANILKSRPPDNRNPKPEEVAAHLPILHKQISLIQPKLILCVGRTSGTSLLGRDSSLKDMRGTFHDYHGIELMVTYHPAALLRNPNWKRPTWEDVQLLRSRYDELTA
ncbi:MAG: uracil-DNA glycosylase [Bacteroidota bacterium]|nr:uracil-DNA glycosylase [Bacteroidota bacterium]